jgi:hypothetical protein
VRREPRPPWRRTEVVVVIIVESDEVASREAAAVVSPTCFRIHGSIGGAFIKMVEYKTV